MPPVTRFAAFKYKASATPELKKKAYDGLLAMYFANGELMKVGPKAGSNTSPEGKDKGFEFGFWAVFKDEQARDDFKTDKRHHEFKTWMDEHIVEDVIVFDFVEGVLGF